MANDTTEHHHPSYSLDEATRNIFEHLFPGAGPGAIAVYPHQLEAIHAFNDYLRRAEETGIWDGPHQPGQNRAARRAAKGKSR